jgi:hypothetical protein
MVAFEFYLQWGEKREVGWVGTTVMSYFVKKKILMKNEV